MPIRRVSSLKKRCRYLLRPGLSLSLRTLLIGPTVEIGLRGAPGTHRDYRRTALSLTANLMDPL